MKNIVIIICLIFFGANRIVAQVSCLNFEQSNNVSNWISFNVTNVSIGEGFNSPNGLFFEDESEGSYLFNNADFTGNWIETYNNQCLCFDFKADWEGAAQSVKFPKMGIFGGIPVSNYNELKNSSRAFFTGNASNVDLIDNQWGHYCLPARLAVGGQLPQNEFGRWEIFAPNSTVALTGTVAVDAWNQLIQDVRGLVLSADYNSTPSEVISFDNFCGRSCPSNDPIEPTQNCCKVDLQIWTDDNGVKLEQSTINGQAVSIASESFTTHVAATAPITEVRFSITDIKYEYNYATCAVCMKNPSGWGSLASTTQMMGVNPNGLSRTSQNYGNTEISQMITSSSNVRELIWSNANGAILPSGSNFQVQYILPPLSEIPCCVSKITICSKISYLDANCNICEKLTCSTIELKPPNASVGRIEIKSEKEGCCKVKLTAISDGAPSFLWDSGETTQSIVVDNNATYNVTATSSTNSLTQYFTVSSIMKGAFPMLAYNRFVYPASYSDDYKKKMYIMDLTKGRSDPHSYNAIAFKLEVWNRWGEMIKSIEKESCDGFLNWDDVAWDGTDYTGNRVKEDDYNWRFRIKNCDSPLWQQAYFRVGWKAKCNCLEYGNFLSLTWCKKWEGCYDDRYLDTGDAIIL